MSNGALPSSALTGISTPGVLRTDAADGFERLRVAARADGFNMGTTHTDHAYRSLARQVVVFEARYTTNYAASAKHDARTWQGRTWWRRPGAGPAATPGTSNHGIGVALDFQGLGGFAGRGYAWMQGNAGRFGWWQPAIYRQGGSFPEPWHWEYVPTLDVDAVSNVITIPAPPAIPAFPIAPEELDMTPAEMTKALRDARPDDYVFFQRPSGEWRLFSPAEDGHRHVGTSALATRRTNVLRTAGYKVRYWQDTVEDERAFGRALD